MPPAERLLVIEPFGEHDRGDRITDEATIRRVLASHPQHVLREAQEEAPEEPKAAKPSTKPARSGDGK